MWPFALHTAFWLKQ